MREGAKLLYGKSVYLKLLFLTRPNFATYDHSSKNETTVDAHGRYIHTLPRIVVYIPEEYPYGIYTYFRVWVNICHAWAFCSCPFRRIGGNAKAWTRGTDDGQVPRFFCIVTLNIYDNPKNMKKIILNLMTAANLFKCTAMCFVVTALIGCCGKVNTTDSKFFTEDGMSTEKTKTFVSQQPANVKFYVEVSGSMNGFFRSNLSTKFKNDVWSVITDFVSSDGQVNVYSEQNKAAVVVPVNTFRDRMNKGTFVSTSSTNVPDMISRMLDDVNTKSSEVGVLISDMKYDPVGNSALQALITQYSTDIRNIMMRHRDVAVCLIAATSEYTDKNGNEAAPDSPYYYLIVGKRSNVVFMRNFIATLLNNNKSFVDEIEWGIDYLSPSITVSDYDYLTEIEVNKSYGGFDDECSITLDFDITNYPWTFENKDYLVKHISIKSEYGAEAVIDTKKITYDISFDDGKQLKRTAIAKIPVKIQNMFDKSDVFEITLKCPEVQEPNMRFMRYLNSQDVNDVTATYSMEGLLQGFYSSMERFKESKPVHLLISTK